ncbi:MAG: sulfotransferase [Cyanobacteria bacterium P01_G01_bin.38]
MIDFLGIGAQKAATTWLFKNLSKHPHIRFPAGKEVHFWNSTEEQRGVKDWLSLFPEVAQSIKQGEITPAYGMLDVDTIQQIYTKAPQLRLFYSVRNPIERAWSSAQMALRYSTMFDYEASDQWFRDHFLSQGSRMRSDYLGTIERWSRVFPVDSLHVIFFDDILAEPRRVLTSLSAHLGVDTGFWQSMSDTDLAEVIRPRSAVRFSTDAIANSIHIRDSLKPFLIDLYQQDIQKMSSYFDRDFSDWLKLD